MNYIISLCAAIFALLYLFVSRSIQVPEFGGPVSGKAFPELLGAVMLLAAAALAIETFFRARRPAVQPLVDVSPHQKSDVKVITGIMAATFLYFLLFVVLGYVLSSSLYMLGMTTYFHRGKHVANIIVSVAFSLITYYGMTKYLGMYLPPGRLF